MSSNDIKYVINSVLSSLDLDSLDEEDKEEIMNKFEGVEDEGDMGGFNPDEMGNNLKPIGSEKLEGLEKIQRISVFTYSSLFMFKMANLAKVR